MVKVLLDGEEYSVIGRADIISEGEIIGLPFNTNYEAGQFELVGVDIYTDEEVGRFAIPAFKTTGPLLTSIEIEPRNITSTIGTGGFQKIKLNYFPEDAENKNTTYEIRGNNTEGLTYENETLTWSTDLEEGNYELIVKSEVNEYVYGTCVLTILPVQTPYNLTASDVQSTKATLNWN